MDDNRPDVAGELIDLETHSPAYWEEAFKGSPLSIIVPPYIRFLQSLVSLRKAVVLLHATQGLAKRGHPALVPLLADLESSSESRQLELTFETFFAANLLVNLVSDVEHFFGSAVSAALRLHPKKMGAHKFDLAEIISASSTDELIERAAQSALNSIAYEKPQDYLEKFAKILSIDAQQIAPHWQAFVELKARRDLGVHNSWIVNRVYLRKLDEAGIASNHCVGDRVRPDFRYFQESLTACSKLVDRVVDLLAKKWMRLELEGPERNSPAN